ncbi:hypothetical protein Ancab_034628 [Ancistrocladus abbreviatus]
MCWVVDDGRTVHFLERQLGWLESLAFSHLHLVTPKGLILKLQSTISLLKLAIRTRKVWQILCDHIVRLIATILPPSASAQPVRLMEQNVAINMQVEGSTGNHSLLWLVVIVKILTKVQRARKGMSLHNWRHRCCGVPESVLHVFYDHPITKALYRSQLTAGAYSSRAMSWNGGNTTLSCRQNAFCWLGKVHNGLSRTEKLIAWTPPLKGWPICRGTQVVARWRCSMVGRLLAQPGKVFGGNCYWMHSSLNLAWELGCSKVVLDCDSRNVVQWVQTYWLQSGICLGVIGKGGDSTYVSGSQFLRRLVGILLTSSAPQFHQISCWATPVKISATCCPMRGSKTSEL